MADAFIKIEPVKGAAIYQAGYDPEKGYKPCVWMTVPADEHCDHECYYIVQTCKTIDAARSAANKWQQKENKAVEKSQNKK